MVAGFKSLFVGIVVYIATNTLVSNLITGTTTSDTIITTILPLAVGLGVVFAAFSLFKGGD